MPNKKPSESKRKKRKDKEYFQVSLPRPMAKEIERIIGLDVAEKYGFDSVRAFVIDAIRKRIDFFQLLE